MIYAPFNKFVIVQMTNIEYFFELMLYMLVNWYEE